MSAVIDDSKNPVPRSEESAQANRSASISRRSGWERAVPWLAGAGIAVGHIAVSTRCTIPQTGHCGACGSCVVVVGSLVGWALLEKRRGVSPFFQQDELR